MSNKSNTLLHNTVDITVEQLFFAVFCIESLSDDLETTGDKVYKMIVDDSDILDGYILPCFDTLHTQGKDYIVSELKRLMRERGVLL